MVGNIHKLATESIKYDPYFNESPDEEMAGEGDADMGDEEYEGWDDEEDGDVQGDVEDTSWKIRKGCVKVIDALVSSCPESL